MNRLAKILPIFSYIFHPIFISIYGALFYFLITPSALYFAKSQVYLILFQVTILTVLLPLSLYFLLVSLGYITSFTEASIKQRRIPIIIQVFLLFTLIRFNQSLKELPELYYFFLGGFLSSLTALIYVLAKFKVSLHMIGIGSLTAFIYGLIYAYSLNLINSIAFLIVCLGLVASSRLYMKSHTNIELIIGLIIGVVSQVSMLFFWL